MANERRLLVRAWDNQRKIMSYDDPIMFNYLDRPYLVTEMRCGEILDGTEDIEIELGLHFFNDDPKYQKMDIKVYEGDILEGPTWNSGPGQEKGKIRFEIVDLTSTDTCLKILESSRQFRFENSRSMLNVYLTWGAKVVGNKHTWEAKE